MTDKIIKNYAKLIENIGGIYENGRKSAFQAVDTAMVLTYWNIGREIVEFEQGGSKKAVYGENLLPNLSKDLKIRFGKGFSKSNIYFMRQFYLKKRIFQTVSGKLSWSHYVELLAISDDIERSFYEKQCINEGWSIRELKRQKDTALFHRLAMSRDKKGILKLAAKGYVPEKIQETIKEPYVLEFLKLPEDSLKNERHLEQKIIDNLQMFLMELGKGFAFVGRQHRITLNNENFYVDLVFYHRIIKCFVLIDLKINKVKHQDIGQMNMYLNYFKAEENTKGDGEPIGIILAAEKDDITVKYATGGISNKLFISKYKLYLPDKKILEDKVREIIGKEK